MKLYEESLTLQKLTDTETILMHKSITNKKFNLFNICKIKK